jgi:hypothetical protein
VGITRHQYGQAMEATDAIAVAADLIMKAAVLLDGVPAQFMTQLEAVEGVEAIDKALAIRLEHLSTEICTAADAASEAGE